MVTALQATHEAEQVTPRRSILNGWQHFYRVSGKPWRCFNLSMLDSIPAGTTIYLFKCHLEGGHVADRFRVVTTMVRGKKRHAILCTDTARVFGEPVPREEFERAVMEYWGPMEQAERLRAERDYCRGKKG